MASFEENVKESFSKVKEHIEGVENEIKRNKKAIIDQIELIKALKMEINALKDSNLLLKNEIGFFLKSSTGNEGVINDHQRSSTVISDDKRSSSSMINNDQQPIEPDFHEPTKVSPIPITKISTPATPSTPPTLTFSDLKKDLEGQFKYLTDREFSVFMTIYHLEESLGKVTPFDIADHLKLSETTVRGYLNSLIKKKLPLERERLFNKKSHFFIKKAFKELNLASKLLNLRNPNSQKTLFDGF